MAYVLSIEEDEVLISPLDDKLRGLLSSMSGVGYDTLLNCARVPSTIKSINEIAVLVGADGYSIAIAEEEAPIDCLHKTNSEPLTEENPCIEQSVLDATSTLASHAKCSDSFKQVYEVIDAGLREYAIQRRIIDPVDNVFASQIVSALAERKLLSKSLKNAYFAIKNIRNIIGHPREPFSSHKDELVHAGKLMIHVFELCLFAINTDLHSVIIKEYQRELL